MVKGRSGDVLENMTVQVTGKWDVMPYALVHIYQLFAALVSSNFKIKTDLAGFFLPKYRASHCRCEKPSWSRPT